MCKELDEIKQKLSVFRDDRDWKRYHSPKNLAEAISIESNELLEIFLWKDGKDSWDLTDTEMENAKQEIADVFIYISYFCDELNVDLFEEVKKKIRLNEVKHPIECEKDK